MAADPWDTYPTVDSLGTLDDKALAAKAMQADQTVAAPVVTTPPISLEAIRGKYANEIAQNPDLLRKIMASMHAEVGDQNDAAHQAYLETVMNRAAARGKSLDATISNPHYYPTSTTSKLGATLSQEQQKRLNPIINNVLAGSNISNFATGNESGNVHSGGAPVTFVPDPKLKYGERFVIENPDREWAKKISSISPASGSIASGSIAQTSAPTPRVVAQTSGSIAQGLPEDTTFRTTSPIPYEETAKSAPLDIQVAKAVQPLKELSAFQPSIVEPPAVMTRPPATEGLPPLADSGETKLEKQQKAIMEARARLKFPKFV